MSKDSAIIFGRSPFIEQVNVAALLPNYTTFGLNQFGRHHRVDYLFFHDAYYAGYKPTSVWMPDWFPQQHGSKYHRVKSDKPLLGQVQKEGALCLGHALFTASLALNFAILKGFKTIYLVGIDHVETDKEFHHHDNDDRPSALTPVAHRVFKQFVYNCADHADIWQCNPAVRADWQLNYKDIRELYHAPNS